MTAENITDDDRALLDHLDQEAEETPEEQLEELSKAELIEAVRDLRDEVAGWQQVTKDLATSHNELEEKFASQQETVQDLASKVNDHDDRLRGEDPSDPRASSYYENLTVLEKYASMSEEEREQTLGSSDRRAVLIFENWKDWAKNVQAGWLISTRHTRGKGGKSAIKVDLTSTGEDVKSTEVYRAMKAVAKLSVTDPDDAEIVTDDYDREHITGGAFEYHEKVNTDANDGKGRKFKVLKLVDEEAVDLP